jgi:hypothetical protein
VSYPKAVRKLTAVPVGGDIVPNSSPAREDAQGSYGQLLEKIFGWYGVLIGIIFFLVADKLPLGFRSYLPFVPTLLTEIGAILVGVGIIHTAYEKVLRKHHEQDVLAAVDKRVEARWRGYRMYRKYAAAGVIAYYRVLPYKRVCRAMARSKNVKILKTFFQEDQFEDAWATSLERSGEEGTVDLFLSDPSSEALRMRSETISPDMDYGRRKVIEEIITIRKKLLTQQNIGRIRVSLYKGWPGAPLILCDDRVYVGTYLRFKKSFETPWVEVRRNSDLGTLLEKQFEGLEVATQLTTPGEFKTWLDKHPLASKQVRNAS